MSISITDIFTESEMTEAIKLWRSVPQTIFHKQAKDTIVMAALPRINEVSKQENDPTYLTYVLEFLANRMA